MDENLKEKYQKYKYVVKMWENNFKVKQGRIPSKYDIREAPREIRDSYKMYYKLKTSFLENTLGDVLTEDGFDILENSQSEFSFASSENDSSVPSLKQDSQQQTSSSLLNLSDLINIDGNTSKPILESQNEKRAEEQQKYRSLKEFEPVAHLDINDRAWNNVNTTVVAKQNKVQKTESSHLTKNEKNAKSMLNTKLFSSKSFSKRNPRKSLSRSDSSKSIQLPSSQDFICSSSQELLPDLEAILIAKSQEKAKEVNSSSSSSSNILDANSKILNRNIDNDWLNRCASTSNGQLGTTCKLSCSPTQSNDQVEKKPQNFGISNINIEIVNNLEKKETQKEECSSIPQSKTKNCNNDYDSDSVISNSEDESTNVRNPIKHIRKKRRIIETINKNLEKAADNTKKELTDNSIKLINNSENLNATKESKSTDKDYEKDEQEPTSNNKFKLSSRKSKSISPDNTNKKISSRKKSVQNQSIRRSSRNLQKSEKMKRKTKQMNEESANESDLDDQPNDINYNLDLGDEELNPLPRVEIKEINQAATVVQEYISNVNSKPSHSEVQGSSSSSSAALEMKKNKLKMKIATGKLNENFVRIDLKKKIYARGKRNTNYSRYKKKMWKKKKAAALSGPDMDMGGCDGGIITCFKCDQPGHFARNCKMKGDTLLPLNVAEMDDDDSLFPSLKEVEEMTTSQTSGNIPGTSDETIKSTESELNEMKSQNKVYIGHRIPEDFLKKCDLVNTANQVEPLYSLNPDGSLQSIPEEVYETLYMFGHKNFRKGQEKAIMRILSGLSTLVTLSTGSGKSLCYQLPAYLYSRKKKCITLVVSPLVSLMEDQVLGVPHFLRAHCLHTNQTPQQKNKVLEMINRGECDILLVSPEAIVAGERSSGFGSILNKLPPIAFACIDEAHCVSQWSHNFRPSYLMICKVLRKKLKIHTILGLTATATNSTRTSIIQHLEIPDGQNGVISDIPLPDNLILTVSKDSNRDAALVELLKSERFSSCQSIIIYCTRRDECEKIAGFIRICFQDKVPETKKRKRVNWYAEAYHAGMPSSRRRTIQNAFMRNELRVIVATIAFGMGINKPDIRAIIHYNMPKAFENYVQECGRAGRDGHIAHCHLFLDSKKGIDQNELKRHIYANSFDRYVIRKLLQKIFIPCSCNKNLEERQFSQELGKETLTSEENQKGNERKCSGHEIGFSIEETVQELDVPEENISTLLYYLELEGKWNLQVLSNAYIMCKVISYGGPKCLKQAAKNCSPLAMAIALQIKSKTFDQDANIIEFPVIEISSAIGWNSGVVKYQLKNLEWTTVNGLPKRSSISVNFYNLGFRVRAPGDLTDDELDDALDALYNRSLKQETAELTQLQCVYDGLSSVAYNSFVSCSTNDFPIDRSNELKKIIRDYFQNDCQKDVEITKMVDTTSDEEIIGDIISMINLYPENQFTGRTLARIFHGIQSPNYPAVMWGRCKYWRAHTQSDFNRICTLANSVIVKMRR